MGYAISGRTAAITGGTINGATIGATTPASGAFTTVTATGAISGLSSVVTKTTTADVSAAEMANTLIQVTGAGTISLPTAAAGYAALIVSTTAAAVSVDVKTGTDVIILDGTALAAGNKASSNASDEATLYVCCFAAGTYRAYSVQGVWSDGGA